MTMVNKCIECGATENDVQYFDKRMDRPRPVKLVKSRYGLLCQRHAGNAYARKATLNKAQKRKAEEHKRMIEDTGQMSMFGEE